MYGIGSGIGAIISAFLLEDVDDPRWAFVVYGLLGLSISVNGILMPKSVEALGEERSKESFCTRGRKNCREIWQGLKIREL